MSAAPITTATIRPYPNEKRQIGSVAPGSRPIWRGKTTSEVRVLDGVDTGAAYAFSFWGGDFWFYTSKDEGPSTVTRLRTADDRLAS